MRRIGIAAILLAAVAVLALVAAIALESGNDHFTQQYVPREGRGGTSVVLLYVTLVAGAAAVFLAATWAASRVRADVRAARGRAEQREQRRGPRP